MPLSDLSSPTAVRLAVAECDRLGRNEFLRKYGFGQARDFVLRLDGREYDSKAIAGVAHGYEHSDIGPLRSGSFSGGADAAGKRLFDLGFNVDGFHRNADDWSLDECEAATDAYFDCLRRKLTGQPYNREESCRVVAKKIGRTKGSVDYKFQNINAVLFKADLPRLNNGIAKNIQRLLTYVVLDPLAARIAVFSDVRVELPPLASPSDVFVNAPPLPFASTNQPKEHRPSKIDFAARDANNRELGRKGEEWVVGLERRLLREAGRNDLADRVRWVAKEDGDGLGYDISSFHVDGSEKPIEVKTTNGGPTTPFRVSENEVATSERLGNAYHLYRLFDFGGTPRVIASNGSLRNTAHLKPAIYVARLLPKANAVAAGK